MLNFTATNIKGSPVVSPTGNLRLRQVRHGQVLEQEWFDNQTGIAKWVAVPVVDKQGNAVKEDD